VRGVAQRVGGASSATLVNSVQYDAFGKVTSQSNATNQPHHGFAGRDIEPVGGLTYNRNRYYSTSSGRFISQDPIGFAAGDANLYRYVGNESTMYTDPSGLERSVTLPNGTVFVAQGTGHHQVPWSVFSDPKFNFSAEVMAVFDGGADNALIKGKWYNFHDGTPMGGIKHTDYSKAVSKELTKFKRGIKDFGPKHAEKFLNHLEGLDARHSIRVFNAGVTAERDLAHEIGDVLYKQYKKDAWFWTRDKTIEKRVKDKVKGYVRELRSSNVSKQKFLKDLVADLSSQVPGKKIASSVVKRLGSALFVWGVVDQITKDGRVNASEIPNAIVLNSPVLGDAIQAGLGLGHVFLYLQEECDNERTGDDWASSGTVYDPTSNNFLTNYHGVTPN
jgi:RHS repeat-associated protein